MQNYKIIEEKFKILRIIYKNPKATQRQLADKLGFSLGKFNYCLNALRKKGLVKIENFARNPNKLNYIYIN